MAERILPLAYDEFTCGSDPSRDYTLLDNAAYYVFQGDMVGNAKGAVITVYKDQAVYPAPALGIGGNEGNTDADYFCVIRGESPAFDDMPVFYSDNDFRILWFNFDEYMRIYDLAVIGENNNDDYSNSQTAFLAEDGITLVGCYVSIQDHRENEGVAQLVAFEGDGNFVAAVAYDMQVDQAGAYIFNHPSINGTSNLKNCTFRNPNALLNSIGVVGVDIGTTVINATNLLLQDNTLDFFEVTGYGGSVTINKAGNKTTGASFGGLGFNTLFDLTGGVAGTVSEDFFGNVVPPGSDFVGATYVGAGPVPGRPDHLWFKKKKFDGFRFEKKEFKKLNFGR